MLARERLSAVVKQLARISIEPIEVSPETLYRVSRFTKGEPYFGRSRGNRWDDPIKEFGVCYLGTSLHIAFAESVLHDAVPEDGQFVVAKDTLESRFVWSLTGAPLLLVPLHGSELKRLGGHNDISAGNDYLMPRRWSRAMYMHPQNFDGILYVSRHKNDAFAVALFDRARSKILGQTFMPLVLHRDYNAVLDSFHVAVM